MKSSEKIKRQIALMLPFENRDIVDNMRLAKEIISAIRKHDSTERKLTKRAPDLKRAARKSKRLSKPAVSSG